MTPSRRAGPPAVVIMAKAPRDGPVKTRLSPLLGPSGSTRLHRALLAQSVAIARELAPARTFVAVYPPEADTEVATMLPTGVRLLGQRGPDLGARLSAASEDVLRRCDGPVLVIGTDIPLLTAEILAQAAAHLSGETDCVFGPALDGGYYLVGMSAPQPSLFARDPGTWGGSTVLADSLAAADRAGLRTALLPPLSDLDTPQDALALADHPRLPAEVAAVLRGGIP